MQRTHSCGSYQLTHVNYNARADEPRTLLPSNSLHSLSSVTHMHWRKKMLNKTVLNKRRQNPARQAAVRSFKKYHFTNQDFLLRKYLRSVKKQMKPKQRDLSEPTNVLNNVSSVNYSNIPMSLASGGCARQRNDIKCKNYTERISRGSHNTSSSSSNTPLPSACAGVPLKINSKTIKKKGRRNWEDVVKSTNPQPIDINKELKHCNIKKWPTNGIGYPTYELLQHDSQPVVFCDNDLKEMINESTKLAVEYSESLRELQDLLDDSECVDSYVTNLTNRSCTMINNSYGKWADNFGQNYRKSTESRSYNNSVSVEACMSKLVIKDNKCNTYQSYMKNNSHNNGGNLKYLTEDYDDDDDDEEEYSDDDDENEYDDDLDDDSDENSEYSDNEDDDSVVDDENCDSSDNATNTKYYNEKSDGGFRKTDRSSKTNCLLNKDLVYKNKRKCGRTRNSTQNLTVPVDTSDSSSVSSSQDNSSVSTETCCSDTIQTIQLNEVDDSHSLNNDCVTKSKMTKVSRSEQPTQLIKVRNKQNQLLMLENNFESDNIKSISAACKPTGYSDPMCNIKCDVQSLMCTETEENINSLYDKDVNSNASDRNYSEKCNKVNTPSKTGPSLNIRGDKQRLGTNSHDDIGTNKKSNCYSRNEYVNKTFRHLNYSGNSQTVVHLKSKCNNKEKYGKISGAMKANGKKRSDSSLFSTVCSVEDGLAFLDNQNQLPSQSVAHNNMTLTQNETITLYNNSTSCTLPVPGTKPNKKQSKRNLVDHNCSKLSNSVASQTSPVKLLNRGCLGPLGTNYLCCAKNKQLNGKLKISTRDAKANVGDLILSTVALNSLLTGQRDTEVAEKFLTMTD